MPGTVYLRKKWASTVFRVLVLQRLELVSVLKNLFSCCSWREQKYRLFFWCDKWGTSPCMNFLRAQNKAMKLSFTLEKIVWKTCHLKWWLMMWRQQLGRTYIWKGSCFCFKANHGVQKQQSVNKEIHEFAYCQKVQCKRPKNDGEEDRGQIVKTLMVE